MLYYVNLHCGKFFVYMFLHVEFQYLTALPSYTSALSPVSNRPSVILHALIFEQNIFRLLFKPVFLVFLEYILVVFFIFKTRWLPVPRAC